MTDEQHTVANGIPRRDQFPTLSYRGYLREKYAYLMQHPEPLESNHPYYMIMGALNDTTTEQARAFLNRQLGSLKGKYDAIYQEALHELDEEKRERGQLEEKN